MHLSGGKEPSVQVLASEIWMKKGLSQPVISLLGQTTYIRAIESAVDKFALNQRRLFA